MRSAPIRWPGRPKVAARASAVFMGVVGASCAVVP